MIDVFLKLEGIKGESKDGKHKDAIDVNGFKWAVDQVGVQNMGGGGGGAGKATVGDIVILKQVDRATPALLLYCVTGKHVPRASIIFRKAGHQPLEYLTIKL